MAPQLPTSELLAACDASGQLPAELAHAPGELVMALEEEFECEIPDEEAEKITTVQQAVDFIKSHGKS